MTARNTNTPTSIHSPKFDPTTHAQHDQKLLGDNSK
jgi:hypothetical protein